MTPAPQTPALKPAVTPAAPSPAAPSPEGRPAAKTRRRPHTGAQAQFARATGWSPTNVNDLVRGRGNLGAQRAILAARLTLTDIKIWAFGGYTAERREAVEAWHRRRKEQAAAQ